MAYDFSISGAYSGRPAYDLYLYVRRDQTDAANNRSSYAWELRARNPSGSSLSYALDQYAWAVSIGGYMFGGTSSLDFRAGQAYIVLGTGGSPWFAHDSAGNLSIVVGAQHGPASIFGTAHPADATFVTDRIPKVPSKPAAPTLNARTTTSITWNFTNPSDNGGSALTTFNHQVSRNSSFTDLVATFDDSSSPASRGSLVAGTSYWVRYRAVNGVGPSAWSDSLQITTLAEVPDAPTLFVPSPPVGTADSISYSWTAPDGNGSAIVEYQTQRALNSSFTSGLDTDSTGLTRSKTWTGLTKATTYYVRARARNGIGWGPWSATASISTAATVPSAPPAPTLNGRTLTSLTWNFTAPSDNGGVAITTYEHQIATNSSFTSGVINLTDATSPASRTGLTPGVNYWIRVRAVNSQGASAWSSALATATLSDVPSAPSMSAPTGITSSKIDTAWTAPNDNGSAILEYQTQRATNSTFTSGLSTVSTGTARTRSWTGLTRATRYYFRSRARNANGWGEWSNVVNATTLATVPGAPSALTTVSRTTTSLTVRRGTPADDGGSTVSTYRYQISTSPTFTSVLTQWESATLDQTASSLTPATTYYIRYQAKNAIGYGAWSPTLTWDTLPATAPGMTVTPSLDGTSTTVQLSPPSGSASVTSYRVERRPLGSTTVTTHNTTSSTLVVQPMTPGTTWEWRASAFIGTYQTPWTAWTTRVQPKPNTTPGDYFDGATAPRGDVTYAWLGTANNSVSEARGVGVDGWGTLTGTSATIRLQRITGGRFGSYAARALVMSDSTGHNALVLGMNRTTGRAAVAEGGVYYGSMYVRPSRAQRLALQLIWFNAAGTEVGTRSNGDQQEVTSTTSWTRLSVSGTAPTGAVGAVVEVRDWSGTGFSPWVSGEWLDADGVMLTIGLLYPYFDGSFPDTSTYRYDWLGTAHASASSRTSVENIAFDPLADPDCPPIPVAPLPPVIDDTCIETVGTWRRYWAIIPGDELSAQLDVVPTITLSTGALAARQVRIRFYRNPDNLEPTFDVDLDIESEQVVTYIPANTTLIIDGVSAQATASVNGGPDLSADHLLYGSDGGPATWPVLSCGTPYLVSFDVPLDAPSGNLDIEVALTTRMM